MSNTLNLHRYSLPESAVIDHRHTWPLRVVAVSSVTDLPSEIFVYRRGVRGDDGFECVASVHQLSELETEPVVLEGGLQKACFRKAELIFHCRSAAEADDLYTEVVKDAGALLSNFRSLDSLALESTEELT